LLKKGRKPRNHQSKKKEIALSDYKRRRGMNIFRMKKEEVGSAEVGVVATEALLEVFIEVREEEEDFIEEFRKNDLFKSLPIH
jgi:hypothetical protein